MDNIPYVFELARIHSECVSYPKFTMTYDEYMVYSKLFDQLPDSAKWVLIDLAKKRRART
jgi:hypothetical protein